MSHNSRPLDVLVRILEERHPDRVRQFFEAYGAPEAAAMCINIACSRPGTHPVVSECVSGRGAWDDSAHLCEWAAVWVNIACSRPCTW